MEDISQISELFQASTAGTGGTSRYNTLVMDGIHWGSSQIVSLWHVNLGMIIPWLSIIIYMKLHTQHAATECNIAYGYRRLIL